MMKDAKIEIFLSKQLQRRIFAWSLSQFLFFSTQIHNIRNQV